MKGHTMTAPDKAQSAAAPVCSANDACATASSPAPVRHADWHRAASQALLLSWVSLAWTTVEGAAGLYAGARANRVSLVGYALSSVVEGLATSSSSGG